MVATNAFFSIVNATYGGDFLDINFKFIVPSNFRNGYSIAFILSSSEGLFVQDLDDWFCDDSLDISIVNSSTIVPPVNQAVVAPFPADNWLTIVSSNVKSGECTSRYSQLNNKT